MKTSKYPFAEKLITDTDGNICQVILNFSDYQRLLEMIEDEGLYQAMILTKTEKPLNLEEAILALEEE